MALQYIFFFCFVMNIIKCAYGVHWSGATEDKCQFTINEELMIYFPDNLRLFVSQFKRNNVSECRSSCCNHETCNGYVWDVMDTDNCKLLKCSSEGQDCKKALKPSAGVTIGEVGFITGITEEATPMPTLPPLEGKSSTLSDSLTWLSQRLQGQDGKSLNNTKSNNVSKKEKNQSTTVKKSHSRNHTASKTSTTTNTIPHVKKDEAPQKMVTPTPMKIVRSSVVSIIAKEEASTHTHTNNISLSIALLFGLSFFVTVVFVLGRRWIEGVRDQHKRGYTRISYLLNGV